MRVPGTKIYRAFQELDRFSDVQCERFLAAALRPMRRTLRWLVSGGIGAAIIGVGCWVALRTLAAIPLRNDGQDQSTSWFILLWITLPTVTVGVFGAALLRDFLLRRRLRRLLRDGGCCQRCGYGLLGLTMSAGNAVLCPECGQESLVDAAFGELTAEGGSPRTVGAEHRLVETVDWNPKRTKMLKRLSVWLGCCLGIVILAAGGAVGWRVAAASADAAKAQSMLHGPGRPSEFLQRLAAVSVEGLDAKIRVAVVGGGEMIVGTSKVVFDEFSPQAAAANPPLLLSQSPGWVEPGLPLTGPADPAQAQLDAAVSQSLFRRLAADGYSQRAEQFAEAILGNEAAKTALPQPDFFPRDEVVQYYMPVHTALNVRRFQRAVLMKNADEAERAFRVLAVVSRVGYGQYPLARESVQLEMLDAVMELLPIADEAMLQRIAKLLREDAEYSATVDSFEHAEYSASQYLYTAFAEGDRTRWGVASFAPGLLRRDLTLAEWTESPRLGRLDENIAAIHLIAAEAKRLAAISPAQRRVVPSQLPEAPSLYLMQFLLPTHNFGRALGVKDRLGLLRVGVATSIAIHRFQRATGAYPEKLADLVPSYMEAVPIDPWSDQALLYQRYTPAGASGRGFVLYSVGVNGLDDGGQFAGNVPGSTPVRAADDFVLSESSGLWRWLRW